MDAPLLLELVDAVHQALRSADSERWDHHDPSTGGRLVDDSLQLRQCVGRFMLAVAVGGFHQQVVGAGDLHRRAQHRVVRPADVAGEEHGSPAIVEVHEGRAEHVPGRRQPRGESGQRLEVLRERTWREQLQAALGVLTGVHRQRGLVFGETVPVGELRLFLLQMAAVGEQDLAQLVRRGRAVNPAAKALSRQQWQVAAMVDVGVGEHDRVDGLGRDRQRLPVAQAQLLESLEQAAVHQNGRVAMAQQVFGTGHGAGGTQKLKLHGRSPRMLSFKEGPADPATRCRGPRPAESAAPAGG